MSDVAERPKSCADWVESNERITLTDFQRLAVEVLVEVGHMAERHPTIEEAIERFRGGRAYG